MITPSYSITATERLLPKLALDFTTAGLDPRVTFTRTTGASNPATYVNSSGYVTAATDNQPRFDYNPVTKVCNGLLIEESRVNNLTYSEDISNAAWNKTNINNTGTPPYVNVAVSPSGVQNADKLIESTANGQHLLSQVYATTNTTITFSVFLKAAERNIVAVQISNNSTGAASARFDLTTGVISTPAADGGDFTATSATITNYSNGWYRCTLTTTKGAVNNVAWPYLALINGTASYTGDGTSGCYVWGAQLEAGAFATSYIPTTTTALTRNADVATMTGTNFSDWFNQTEGAITIQFQKPTAPVASSFIRAYEISDGTTNNRMRVMLGATSTDVFDVTSGGASVGFCDVGAYTTNSVTKITGAYKTDSFIAAQNGGSPTPDTSGTISWTMNQIVFGGNATGGGSYLNGYVQKFFYYPQRLINNEVRAFSK